MINPFTINGKIQKLQQDVLLPLYTMHPDQESSQHPWLLVLTGRIIEKNRRFLEEIATSNLVATVFKIVKLLGGAERLTSEDFERFTGYVNSGGLKAMVKMLLAADKDKAFVTELRNLPASNRQNAQRLLEKSAELHNDFITGFFKEQYGDLNKTPPKLLSNFEQSTTFIIRLAKLAEKEQAKRRE